MGPGNERRRLPHRLPASCRACSARCSRLGRQSAWSMQQSGFPGARLRFGEAQRLRRRARGRRFRAAACHHLRMVGQRVSVNQAVELGERKDKLPWQCGLSQDQDFGEGAEAQGRIGHPRSGNRPWVERTRLWIKALRSTTGCRQCLYQPLFGGGGGSGDCTLDERREGTDDR